METMNTPDKSAVAMVSVLLLAAVISMGSLMLRADGGTAAEAHSFIGTTPDAAAAEPLPPTF